MSASAIDKRHQTPQRHTAANLAVRWQRLIGPAIAVNVALYAYVMFEPILETRFLFFSRNEIIIARAAYDLYATDTLLFLVVFLFGILAPGLKLIAFALFWHILDVHQFSKNNKWLVLLGRWSMLEIMLLAILVVAIKGIGIGSVNIKPGLYFYVALVLGSFLLSLSVDRQLAIMLKKIQRPPVSTCFISTKGSL